MPGAALSIEVEPTPQMGEPTMAAALRTVAANLTDQPALRTRGDELTLSWGEYYERAGKIAAGFAGIGLKPGETLGIMLTNRPEFHLVDAAAMLLGLTPFSIYNTFSAEQVEHLLADSETRVVVTERALLPAIGGAADGVERIVVIDAEGEEGTMTLAELEDAADPEFDLDASIEAIDPEQVLTLIYTSGTTGPPKGVQITHANVMAIGPATQGTLRFPPDGSRIVSYLPMAHIAERVVGHYLPILVGATVTDCPDPREVVSYLPDVRPTWFFAVPRIWEKLRSGLQTMFAGLPEEQGAKARAALEASLSKVRLEQAGEEVPAELAEAVAKADAELFAPLRAKLGLDELRAVNVGAAPTPPEVIEFFHAIGVPLSELWGMSETCGLGTINPPERIKIGTVGVPSPGAEIRLAEDGELLVRGPFVMKGYRNQPEQTAETIDADGWLRTGDVGEIDADGYLRIVDRKKELIINAAGKNMSPANIEAKLKLVPLVGQACAIGDGRKYIAALLTLDPDAAPAWAEREGIEARDLASLAADERVIAEVERGIERANEGLARVEQVKRFKLLPADWEPGGDELTPTMKLKRKPVAAKYAAEIEALYPE